MFKILKKFNNKTLEEIIIITFTRFKRFFFKKLITESESGNKAYLDLINKSIYDQNTFINFKNHLTYRENVETVTYYQGKQLLKSIIKNENYLLGKINKFIQNDKIGNPKKYFYSELNEKISPTTLRYIKIAGDIKKIFKDKLNNIAEIGCGYGGQYLILDNIFEINKYLLIDLHEVNLLIEKYLDRYLLNSTYETKTINRISQDETYDLVISNYAFSELPTETQLVYINKILLKSKNGYMIMNSGLENSVFTKNHLSLEKIKILIPNIKILKEEDYDTHNNYVIIWGNTKI